jgi:rubrerythrin
MTTYDCLLKAEEIERIAAGFYTRLAQIFAGDPALKKLFTHLAEEESQHCARVALLRKQYSANRKLLAFAEGTGEALAAVHAVAEAILAEVQAGTWGSDARAVCLRLSAFEEQLGDAHAHELAESASPAVKGFFLALAKQDRAHRDLLKPGGLAGR